MTDLSARIAPEDGVGYFCAMSREFLAVGQANLAVQALLRALAENRHSLDAHYQLLRIIWQTVDGEIAHLGTLWAGAILPGLSLAAAEEFLIETFGDHPDRYELFLAAANFAMRRGEVEQAECLLSYCLQPTDGGDWRQMEVKGKYDDIAAAYEDEAPHRVTAENCRAVARRLLDGRSGLTVVEVACGTGALAAVLRPHAAVLVGSDLSSEMARLAEPHYDQMIVADMTEALNGLGPVADIVMCFGALYYSHDLAPFLFGAAAALKPGGDLVFSDFAAPEGGGEGHGHHGGDAAILPDPGIPSRPRQDGGPDRSRLRPWPELWTAGALLAFHPGARPRNGLNILDWHTERPARAY